MSLNDSSAIILIIGALAVLGFVIHGLWFSGRSVNRKLMKNNKLDQEIIKSSGVGKVRIVTTESPNRDKVVQQTYETFEHENTSAAKNETENEKSADEEVSIQTEAAAELNDTYELNLMADSDKPYHGEDIQEICDKYGFLRGDSDLFYVYENPTTKDKVVFRICSLKRPFSFPKDMSQYETPALAIYMDLPQRGSAFAYFKAMRMAADIFIERLGGRIQDNNYHDLSVQDLDRTAAILKDYDETPE